MTVSLTGSLAQRLADALRFSELNRRHAVDRVTRTKRAELPRLERIHRLASMRPPTDVDVDAAADAALRSDPVFKVAVSNEQWGARLAAAYGSALVAERLEYVAGQNAVMIRLLSEVVDLLRRPVDPPAGSSSDLV